MPVAGPEQFELGSIALSGRVTDQEIYARSVLVVNRGPTLQQVGEEHIPVAGMASSTAAVAQGASLTPKCLLRQPASEDSQCRPASTSANAQPMDVLKVLVGVMDG